MLCVLYRVNLSKKSFVSVMKKMKIQHSLTVLKLFGVNANARFFAVHLFGNELEI